MDDEERILDAFWEQQTLSGQTPSETPPEPPSAGERWSARHAEPTRRIDVLVLLAIVALVAVPHFWRLGTPNTLIPLDEVHYVPDARDVLAFGTDSDVRAPENSSFVVHPPVGKWFIAAGIRLFGDDGFGWRFFGALLGTLSSAVVYLLARRLWASPWWAAMAALLLGVEGLWFVQSRVAMLDIYAGFFVLVGAWLLLEDRARAPGRLRWWRLGAAVAFGVALATKWSVAPMVAAAAGMAFAWDLKDRHGEGSVSGWVAKRTGAAAGTFLLLPAVVYLATFTPWFADAKRYAPPRCEDEKNLLVQWGCYQKEMLDFHRGLDKFRPKEEKKAASPAAAKTTPGGATPSGSVEAPQTTLTASGARASGTEPAAASSPSPTKTVPAHPYFGETWSWPWIGRPVAHYYEASKENTAAERRREVLGLPNPVVWFPAFFIGLPALAWWTIRRKDPVAPMLFAFFVAGFLPYLAADVVGRPVFLFYATPLVPFLVLTVVHCFVRAAVRWPDAARSAIGYTFVAVVVFAYFYPVLAASPIAPRGVLGWNARMWLTVDCTVEDQIKILCWI